MSRRFIDNRGLSPRRRWSAAENPHRLDPPDRDLAALLDRARRIADELRALDDDFTAGWQS